MLRSSGFRVVAGAALVACVARASGGLTAARVRKASLLFDLDDDTEAMYARYALGLAATEPLRETRDAALRRAMGRPRWLLLRAFGRRNACDPAVCDASNPQWRSACARHGAQSSRALDAVAGLTVAEFNRATRVVAATPALKKRVLRQAYLYRLAARIEPRRNPSLPAVRAFREKEAEVSPADESSPKARDIEAALSAEDLRLFASVARKVESLRQQERQDLIALLKVDEFPDYPICDPRVLPLMSKEVRAVCADFPHKAADLVQSHGIDFPSFQRLLDKAEQNPFFRWRLARTMRTLKRSVNRKLDED